MNADGMPIDKLQSRLRFLPLFHRARRAASCLGQSRISAGGTRHVLFRPSSRNGGIYSYTGSMSASGEGKTYRFRHHGNGKYQVAYVDDVAVSILAEGPGTVETPYGPETGEATEHYTLKPLGEEPCTQAEL